MNGGSWIFILLNWRYSSWQSRDRLIIHEAVYRGKSEDDSRCKVMLCMDQLISLAQFYNLTWNIKHFEACFSLFAPPTNTCNSESDSVSERKGGWIHPAWFGWERHMICRDRECELLLLKVGFEMVCLYLVFLPVCECVSGWSEGTISSGQSSFHFSPHMHRLTARLPRD